ncbi:MAG: adenylate/guanylate cyclase domain-containing protein, partial [Verrucomicrobia bacterium]|nr:adenylate/guanylate cyclase domain-containing protein [Verrucomicrobiota bacterium]
MQQWLQHLWSTRVRRDRMVVMACGLFWSLLVVVLVLLRAAGLLTNVEFLDRWELASVDARYEWRGWRPPLSEIVIVGIDDESFVADTFSPEELKTNPDLQFLSTWPWPRRAHGLALQKLLDAGAKVVDFDLLFSTPSKYGPDDDKALREALARAAGRVIIGANCANESIQGGNRQKWMFATPEVIPAGADQTDLCAAVNFSADIDGVVRHLTPRWWMDSSKQWLPSVSARIANMVDSRTAWAYEHPEIAINFPCQKPMGDGRFQRPFPRYPYYQLFYSKAWKQALQNGAVFKDKIVLVGPTQNFLHDVHATPNEKNTPGVEIHAAAISTLIRHNELREQPNIVLILLTLGFAVITVLSLLWVRHPLLKLVLPLLIAMAHAVICQIAFSHFRLLLPFVAPVVVMIPIAISGTAWQLLTEQLEKRRARQALERQVSKEVADELMKEFGALQLLLAPQERPLVVFFSDIRNFTTLFEKGDAKTLITQLNEYLTAMSAVVAKHGGTLDKYIGDAIMAFWGAPTSRGPADDALRAVSAALEMRKELAALQPQWKAKGYPEIKIGVGIHAGAALVGEVGSAQRSEYTAIGDTVNTASRIEGINKETGT